MTVATRTEVGICDLGNVFIFARTSSDGESWMVRAGNHTIATVDSEARAKKIAKTLCETVEEVAEPVAVVVEKEPTKVAPGVTMSSSTAKYVAEQRKKASKK